MTNYNPEEDIRTGKELISIFKSNLPEVINSLDASEKSKIPSKALTLRETLLYRVTELGETALDLYGSQNRIISAIIITRATHETVALFHWFYDRMLKVVETQLLGDFDQFIMNTLFGWKLQDKDFPTAYNVLTAIDKLDKKFDGTFRSHYDGLSEFCHPNYAGVHGAYGVFNPEDISVELGRNKGRISPIVGLPPLISSLEIFRHFYNKSGDLMPKFIEICEEDLERT